MLCCIHFAIGLQFYADSLPISFLPGYRWLTVSLLLQGDHLPDVFRKIKRSWIDDNITNNLSLSKQYPGLLLGFWWCKCNHEWFIKLSRTTIFLLAVVYLVYTEQIRIFDTPFAWFYHIYITRPNHRNKYTYRGKNKQYFIGWHKQICDTSSSRWGWTLAVRIWVILFEYERIPEYDLCYVNIKYVIWRWNVLCEGKLYYVKIKCVPWTRSVLCEDGLS